MFKGFQNFLPFSTLSWVFSSCGFSSCTSIFKVYVFSSSFFSHLNSLFSIFFSCFFCSFFKQWILLQALGFLETQALLQVMMRSCLTWIKEAKMLFHLRFISQDLFTTTKVEEGRAFRGPNYWCLRCVSHTMIHLALFKNLTNFNATKFEDLTSIVVSTISFHA
jgi:hypothetical protein